MFLGKLSNNDNEPSNQTPTKITSCVASTRPRANPKEIEKVIRVVLRYSVVRILWVVRILRFIRSFSVIRAGLREADHVLGGTLWSSGL
jgi:hypothetical protein